jgi:hypothetical protein
MPARVGYLPRDSLLDTGDSFFFGFPMSVAARKITATANHKPVFILKRSNSKPYDLLPSTLREYHHCSIAEISILPTSDTE